MEHGYDVVTKDDKGAFYAEMDFEMNFNKCLHKLTLRELDVESSSDIAISYIPWASPKIHIGYCESRKAWRSTLGRDEENEPTLAKSQTRRI